MTLLLLKFVLAKEQMTAIEKFKSNIEQANARMTMAENALNEVSTVLTRIYELAIQGRNDSLYSARQGFNRD